MTARRLLAGLELTSVNLSRPLGELRRLSLALFLDLFYLLARQSLLLALYPPLKLLVLPLLLQLLGFFPGFGLLHLLLDLLLIAQFCLLFGWVHIVLLLRDIGAVSYR